MESALAWIGQLAEWIGQFIPRIRNVRVTHKAIKFLRGRVKVVDPGLRGFWPLTTDFIEYPIVRQAIELRGQTIVTTDDKIILVGGMLVYEVDDLEKLWTQSFNPEQTLKDLTLTVVHDVCCRWSWDVLKREQRDGTLDTKLKNEAKKVLEPYGVTVIKLMLTDLAPCRVLKLVQTTAKGED